MFINYWLRQNEDDLQKKCEDYDMHYCKTCGRQLLFRNKINLEEDSNYIHYKCLTCKREYSNKETITVGVRVNKHYDSEIIDNTSK